MNRMNWALAAAGAIACGMPAALAQPRIEVRIADAIIENNHEHAFPLTEIGATVPLIVVVRNVGSEDLVFVNDPPVDMGGGFPEQFILIQPPLEAGNKLSPNGSTAFRVDFAPAFEYYRLSTRLFLWTNDPDTLFALTVAGESFDPNAPSEPGDDAGSAEGPDGTMDDDDTDPPQEGDSTGEETTETETSPGTGNEPQDDGDAGAPSEADEDDGIENDETAQDIDTPTADDDSELAEGIEAQEGLCGFGVPFALFSGLLGLTATRRAGHLARRA